ncbi:Hpt domain-containing protein [Legionella worsleiensis]|uniref:Sensory box histidine kinase/response regulator n=1 Tax=Legionella worsleiensis TaxID=45076 RepID=A0A0W1A6D4_9GAMM|nr:Hpt domain-containing protein [Legionella worsleiensis]KTD76909.1 sensory box histidine kinase/response regulator [Legionella worsleiensis]STY33421.1 Aerobic respiration control sensor protein ArcB [Legionella worsleiensis]
MQQFNKARRDLPNSDNELFELNQFPLFDKEQAIKNCGNESILLELVTLMALKQIPEDLEHIKTAFQEQDYSLVERIAHKIKSGAMYLGTTRMKFACQYVERYRKSGEDQLFAQLYSQAVKVIEETERFLTDWLEKYTPLNEEI